MDSYRAQKCYLQAPISLTARGFSVPKDSKIFKGKPLKHSLFLQKDHQNKQQITIKDIEPKKPGRLMTRHTKKSHKESLTRDFQLFAKASINSCSAYAY